MTVKLLYSNIWVLILALASLQPATAQDTVGNLDQYMRAAIEQAPEAGEQNFQKPDSAALDTWEQAFRAVLKGSINRARSLARGVGYEVVAFQDTTQASSGQLYYVLQPQPSSRNYWGYYVLDPSACPGNLILQCPHPQYDFNTGEQGTYCFKRTDARVLMISGTHRCNRSTYSACTGTTSVCADTSEPYRVSDPAHTLGTAFQRATAVLKTQTSQSTFIQLHGFAKQASDPYVILSNGTREQPENDPAMAIRNGLEQADSALTFRIGHRDTGWDRLLGFSNVQGRLINNSQDPCRQNASRSQGRFLHVEQELSRLRRDSGKWAKMAAALRQAFPCNKTGREQAAAKPAINLYPNPASSTVQVNARAIERIAVYQLDGQLQKNKDVPGRPSVRLTISSLDRGLYLIRVEQPEVVSQHRLVVQ